MTMDPDDDAELTIMLEIPSGSLQWRHIQAVYKKIPCLPGTAEVLVTKDTIHGGTTITATARLADWRGY